MTSRAHFFGDGCPEPHGSPLAPWNRWGDPGETVGQCRARYGQHEDPRTHDGPGGWSVGGESHSVRAGAVA